MGRAGGAQQAPAGHGGSAMEPMPGLPSPGMGRKGWLRRLLRRGIP